MVYLLRQLERDINGIRHHNVAVQMSIARPGFSLWKPCWRLLRKLKASEFVRLFGPLSP